MRFFLLEQGSSDWFEWRKKGIGASDSPIIMGISPFKTPYQLFQEKKGLADKKALNDYATRKGHQMEPSARMSYEIMTGIDMKPVTVAHEEHSWLKASLDGWSSKYKLPLEIKYPGKKDWKIALEGKIPEYYMIQIQHQLLVTGAEKAHYYAFNGEIGRLIVVQASAIMQAAILSKAEDFMERLRLNNPPELMPEDTMEINEPSLVQKVQLYRKLKSQIKLNTETLKALEKDIGEACLKHHSKCSIDGLRVIRYKRKGSINWDEIKKNHTDIDYESYRKESTEICQLRDKEISNAS